MGAAMKSIIQFTWWMKGNKKGCRPAGVDRMELEFLDEDINRTLPGMIFDLRLTLDDLAWPR